MAGPRWLRATEAECLQGASRGGTEAKCLPGASRGGTEAECLQVQRLDAVVNSAEKLSYDAPSRTVVGICWGPQLDRAAASAKCNTAPVKNIIGVVAARRAGPPQPHSWPQRPVQWTNAIEREQAYCIKRGQPLRHLKSF